MIKTFPNIQEKFGRQGVDVFDEIHAVDNWHDGQSLVSGEGSRLNGLNSVMNSSVRRRSATTAGGT